jgi:hypothetical protein
MHDGIRTALHGRSLRSSCLQSMRVLRHLVDTVPMDGENPPDIDPKSGSEVVWKAHD